MQRFALVLVLNLKLALVLQLQLVSLCLGYTPQTQAQARGHAAQGEAEAEGDDHSILLQSRRSNSNSETSTSNLDLNSNSKADSDLDLNFRRSASDLRRSADPNANASANAKASTPHERLVAARPLAWIHVPKCGQSFINFLIRLPGNCPGIPDNITVSCDTFGQRPGAALNDKYRLVDADGACPGSLATWGLHSNAGDWDSIYKGHALIMLRQPEQRLLSGYHYGYHAWPLKRPPADVREYAEVMQGCAVRKLTHGGCAGPSGPPSKAEVDLAIQRLRQDFVFVGITGQWWLSMCLGHRVFGGQCRLSDFVDGRVTNRDVKGERARGPAPATVSLTTPLPYDVSPLQGFKALELSEFSELHELYDLTPMQGFKDKYDGALYEAALELFEESLARYDVSMESCRPCFEEAGLSKPS